MTSGKTDNQRLIVYGHEYCGQARALARMLAKHDIVHEWRDVMNGEPHFRDQLKKLARGYLSVPTVVFPDGTVMIEPWPDQVLEKLGYNQEGWLEKLLRRVRGE